VFSVSDGYPNPFNQTVGFHITLPPISQSRLTVDVYNVLGQHVFSRTFHTLPRGQFHWSLDSRLVFRASGASGRYFITFSYAGQSITKKVLFLK